MPTIQLHCTTCQHKVFTDGTGLDGLVPVVTANPPRRADGVTAETLSRGKMFKCPKCGFVMRPFNHPGGPPPETAPAPPPDEPKDMDELMYGDKLGDNFIREVDRMVRNKKLAADRISRRAASSPPASP